MVCILFVLQLQRYKIILDFCYILQSFLYSILHFITLLQRVGNFSDNFPIDFHNFNYLELINFADYAK